MFYNGETDKIAFVHTNLSECSLKYDVKQDFSIKLNYIGKIVSECRVDDLLMVGGLDKYKPYAPPIKKYSFNQNVVYHKSHAKYLIPPFGSNLLPVIENYKDLKRQVVDFFREYGLEIVFDKAS